MSKVLLPKNETDTGTPGTSDDWEYVDMEELGSLSAKENMNKSWTEIGLLAERIRVDMGKIDSLYEELKQINEELKQIKDGEKSASSALERIKEDIKVTKETTKEATSFMMTVAGVIVVTFFIASIPIFSDYLSNNQKRYEKFITEISGVRDEITNKFYSKEELKNLIEENNKDKQILDCIKIKGYFTIQCFNQ